VATLEHIERFPNSRKVTDYVRLDPVEESSGQRRRIGAISKQGPRLLRLFSNEAG
jgi:transposase